MSAPEALRLADRLDLWGDQGDLLEAAAELRRLDAECNDLAHQLNQSNERNGRLIAQRDALLEALRTLLSYANVLEMRLDADGEHRAMQQARAAIAKAEGEKT